MPKPVPFPFNVGTDICYIPRILNIIRHKNAPSFLRRFLTEKEREYYKPRVDQKLETWHHTKSAKDRIKQKQKELGVTDSELQRCREWKREGRFGAPSDWLLELKAEFKAANGNGGRKFKDVDSGTTSGIKPEAIVDDLELGDALIESSTPVPIVDKDLDEQSADETLSGDKPNKGVTEIETIKGDSVEESVDYDELLSEFSHGPNDMENSSDLDMMFHLLEQNEAATAAAETSIQEVARFLAGRFAAKEAAIKAHHSQRLTYQRIAILPASDGDTSTHIPGSRPPIAVVIPEDGKWEDAQEIKISISHDKDYATAVCLAYDAASLAKINLEEPGEAGEQKRLENQSQKKTEVSSSRRIVLAPTASFSVTKDKSGQEMVSGSRRIVLAPAPSTSVPKDKSGQEMGSGSRSVVLNSTPAVPVLASVSSNQSKVIPVIHTEVPMLWADEERRMGGRMSYPLSLEALELFPWRKRLLEALSKDRSAGLNLEKNSTILIMWLPQDITEADLYETLQCFDKNVHIRLSNCQPSEEFRLAFARFSSKNKMQHARMAVNNLNDEKFLAGSVYDTLYAEVRWEDLIASASTSTTGHAGNNPTTKSSDHLVLQHLLEVEELRKQDLSRNLIRMYWWGNLIINLPRGTTKRDLARHFSPDFAGTYFHIFPPRSTNLVDAFVVGRLLPETDPFGEEGLFKSPVVVKTMVGLYKELSNSFQASPKAISLVADDTAIKRNSALDGGENVEDISVMQDASG